MEKNKCILCAIALVTFATPALAAKFYVVRDTTTKQCSVAEQKPTEGTTKIVGQAHKSQARAEKAMKASVACSK
jgi:hypothetical protein